MSSPSEDSSCFSYNYFTPWIEDGAVSQSMINCLNLTVIENYVKAYCTRPPRDDDCPFDFCPNPEVAGPLVRIANYVTTFCVAILVFYSPKRVNEAFWSQILTIYSLLLTSILGLYRDDLTRFHALVVLALVLSPITVYFLVYSIRSFWSSQHRLEHLLGPSHYLKRSVVVVAAATWLGIFIYTYLPKAVERFSQASCGDRSIMVTFYLIVPFLYGKSTLVKDRVIWPVIAVVVPFALLTVAWTIAILQRRQEIWPPGEPYRPRFVKVWRTVGYYYPFIQFLSVVVMPMAYWILVVELGTYGTSDNTFSLSFGQVFALFVAVPPLLQTLQLLGDVWYWFRGISWVQRVAGPPPERRRNEKRDSYFSISG